MCSASEQVDVLIVGAGFAGLSTAYHLSRQGNQSILVLEREKLPGYHASGRNAALVLQSCRLSAVRRLTVASRKAYEKLIDRIDFQQNGSLLLGSAQTLEEVRDTELLYTEFWDTRRVRKAVPALMGHPFEAALWTPSDGVMDIAALLEFYRLGALEAGVRIDLDRSVTGVRGGEDFEIETSRGGPVCARTLVNAAGAWAPAVAKLASAAELPLFPLKRHLFQLEGVNPSPPKAPFVYDLEDNFYFRPESEGLLFSLCDEEVCQTLDTSINDEIGESLAELIWRRLPALQDATQKRVWSCFRTRSMDELFVIGWDPQRPGFFWAAGLGGQGMASSWEAGRLASRLIQGGEDQQYAALQPDRFLVKKP